jgi:sRNA-binding protein
MPLAIGVYQQIRTIVGAELPAKDITRFLAWWCTRSDYLFQIAYGVGRVHLDGSPAGLPAEPERLHAAQKLYGAKTGAIMAKIAARRDMAPQEPPRPLPLRPGAAVEPALSAERPLLWRPQ